MATRLIVEVTAPRAWEALEEAQREIKQMKLDTLDVDYILQIRTTEPPEQAA